MLSFLQRTIRQYLSFQFLKFLAVGITAAGLHWLARYILNFYVPFSLAVAIAYGVGIIVAFTLNYFFVFSDGTRPISKQCRDFIIINVAFFPIVWVFSMLIRNLLIALSFDQYSADLAHAMAISIPTFATFLIYKYFTFK
ncbi:MAG: GtrA family protein [Litorimonas sp.]